MTDDRLAKVRAEIERRYKYNKEHENDWAGTSHFWQRKEDEEILSFIDSMQEECNITGIKSKHATGKLKECIDNQTEEGLEQARKQLEENPQECMYARDNYTDEDRKALCEDCKEKCAYAIAGIISTNAQIKKEPVSEDLEEAATTFADVHVYATRKVCFKAGANWQKQQMMKDAVDGKIYETQARSKLKATTIGKISSLDYRVGDKVKLIIIKED